MRISDWSSDVCSSDLVPGAGFPARWRPTLAGRSGRWCDDGRTLTASLLCRTKAGRMFEHDGQPRIDAGRTGGPGIAAARREGVQAIQRSEEHTSELQSPMRISYAVFSLKKKHTNNMIKAVRMQT